MTPEEFIAKWQPNTRNERAACQEHFIDLCRLLDEPTPNTDPTGASYAFEKGATKATGGDGWADVWRRERFAWEYKGKHKNLEAAHKQLLLYAGNLGNPPLLVVSDIQRIIVRTAWTNAVSERHDVLLEELTDPLKRRLLKNVFSDPDQLRPTKTRATLTAEAAAAFAGLAERLRQRGHDPAAVAHFVNRLVFCLFADDVRLLPTGLFEKMLAAARRNPARFVDYARRLFRAMAEPDGELDYVPIQWFNGGLFDDDTALPLDADDIEALQRAAALDWAEIDPSIFGTLFERGLDPAKRSQLGAHYTDRDKIMLIIEPVIMRPFTAAWSAERDRIAARIEAAKLALNDVLARTAGVLQPEEEVREVRPRLGDSPQPALFADLGKQRRVRNVDAARAELRAAERAVAEALAQGRGAVSAFLRRIREFRVLDPACGSGNFLYLALLALKDLEQQVNLDAEALGFQRSLPAVGPQAVLGIEINPYAAELARVSVWIGEIQWMRRNGYTIPDNPILKPLDNIEHRDAILTEDESEAEWPDSDVIIGNPPFCGVKHQLERLTAGYTATLRKVFEDRLPALDLAAYWFEKALGKVRQGRCSRVGLVATRSLRKGANRTVLDRVEREAVIFDAWDNEKWILDGASVRVCLVCFAARSSFAPRKPKINGNDVSGISADLTENRTDGVNLLRAQKLASNSGSSYIGAQLSGAFDVPGGTARRWLRCPTNPNGRPNSDVLRPLIGGDDITGRNRDEWVVDFGTSMTVEQAALYEEPFEHVRESVWPARQKDNRSRRKERWWLFGEPSPGLRKATSALERFIATSLTGRHRFFIWCHPRQLPDSSAVAIGHSEDWMFGLLSSRAHALWAQRMGNNIGAGGDDRYTPSTTFNTFPFPEGLTPDIRTPIPAVQTKAQAISAPARRLDSLRGNWLNPPDLVKALPEVVPGYSDRLVPVNDEAAAVLRSRTLTDLYNQEPAWLANAHRDLDEAIAAAYGWPVGLTDDEMIARLFALNQGRAPAGAGKSEEEEDIQEEISN